MPPANFHSPLGVLIPKMLPADKHHTPGRKMAGERELCRRDTAALDVYTDNYFKFICEVGIPFNGSITVTVVPTPTSLSKVI